MDPRRPVFAPFHLPAPSRHSPEILLRPLPTSDWAALARAWTAIEQEVGNGKIACSWDWTEEWLRHYGDVVPHRVLVGERAGVPCGIVLLTAETSRDAGVLPVRSVHIGTAGEPLSDRVWVEYNRILVAPAARAAFVAALTATLRQDRSWDALVLDEFAPEEAEPFFHAEPDLRAVRSPCPTFDLRLARQARSSVLAQLQAKTRRKVNQSLRLFGQVETHCAETETEALEILDELISLHQERWTQAGKPGAFSSARFRDFHRAVAPRLLERGAAMLFRVRARGQTLGCLYHFIEGRNILFYQSGFAAFEETHARPGYLTHALCMQVCLDRGLDEYNFLTGDTPYKRELANTVREVVSARARRPRVQFAVGDALRWARRLAKAVLRSAPVRAGTVRGRREA